MIARNLPKSLANMRNTLPHSDPFAVFRPLIPCWHDFSFDFETCKNLNKCSKIGANTAEYGPRSANDRAAAEVRGAVLTARGAFALHLDTRELRGFLATLPAAVPGPPPGFRSATHDKASIFSKFST